MMPEFHVPFIDNFLPLFSFEINPEQLASNYGKYIAGTIDSHSKERYLDETYGVTHAVLGNGTITITNPTAHVQDITTISHDVNNAQVILEENHQHGTLSFPTSMLTDPVGTMQYIGNGIANSDVLIDAVGHDIQQAPENIADSIANATDWIKTTFDPTNIPESTSITLTKDSIMNRLINYLICCIPVPNTSF